MAARQQKTKKLTVQIPADIYQALQQIAGAADSSLDEVVVLTLRNGMPPRLNHIPAAYHEILLNLNKLGDEALWDILSGRRRAPKSPTAEGDQENFTALWQAYAFSLLKWRGHPVPDPHEFIL